MEYYPAIKRNETGLFVVRWMDLETVIQSEVSQKEKNKYCMQLTLKHFREKLETESESGLNVNIWEIWVNAIPELFN